MLHSFVHVRAVVVVVVVVGHQEICYGPHRHGLLAQLARRANVALLPGFSNNNCGGALQHQHMCVPRALCLPPVGLAGLVLTGVPHSCPLYPSDASDE